MWLKCVSLLVSLTLINGESHKGFPQEVRLKQGHVRGYKEPGKSYYAFYGIPYATAPTGNQRFKAPLPPPVWVDILDATNKNILCPQTAIVKNIIKNKNPAEQEDCLVTNVYTPDTKMKLPVVVYIHGGAFQLGYGDMLTHDPLLQTGKIVEVTFNYRLGAHGFLCLGTEDVPGNAGMKDQVAALRWVKENIAKFGGDPNDVTIAGYSAGAASVELLLLSKSAQGLFDKVILESGSGLSVWAVQIDPIANAYNYARFLNYDGDLDDVYALEQFYKKSKLDFIQVDPFIDRADSTFVFVPCIERNANGSFLSEVPIDIIKSRQYSQVPTFIGFGNLEGIFRLPLYETWREKMEKNFEDFLPADLIFEDDYEKYQVSKHVKEFYFKNKSIGMATLINFVEYFTDIMFAYPILRSVRNHLEAGSDSIYLYQYSFVDENRPLPYNVYGADHCAQSLAISRNIYVEDTAEVSESYAAVKELLTELWINFIATGKPVPKDHDDFPAGWPAISQKDQMYIELHGSPELRKDLLNKRKEFWDSIYESYYRRPQSPPEPKFKHSEL